MTELLIVIQIIFTVIMGMYFLNALKGQQVNKIVIDKENKKEMDKLNTLRSISLNVPLSEKSRPTNFYEILGQENGIKALKAAICGVNPQHVLIYGPPGVGKTAAARLVLDEAKSKTISPFKGNAKFIEIDATTIRFDDRGIADPLIGSVHDPIYQGAGQLGIAGIPQPKMGAVSKAHGGILFIDEIGELHPIEMNKLLKVLEDRKVFFDSAYYNTEDPNMPDFIKDIFEKGFPADFRLIGATTKSPEEISPALRSRCIEIYFRALLPEEILEISKNAAKRLKFDIEDKACELIGQYCSNGRDAVNVIQMSVGLAAYDERKSVTADDVFWVLESGQYTPKPQKRIKEKPEVGYVNGLAVYGSNIGTLLEIEASANKVARNFGKFKITGIIEEEEINALNKKVKRKSMAYGSVENVLSMIEKVFSINYSNYNIHVNFPGGIPVDGPSAGISIATAVYSAIKGVKIDNELAMTGEITLYGDVKPVGGINAKIDAAIKSGIKRIIIPEENWKESFKDKEGIKIYPVTNIKQVLKLALVYNKVNNSYISLDKKAEILSAESINSQV